jgi:hypothetical protein
MIVLQYRLLRFSGLVCYEPIANAVYYHSRVDSPLTILSMYSMLQVWSRNICSEKGESPSKQPLMLKDSVLPITLQRVECKDSVISNAFQKKKPSQTTMTSSDTQLSSECIIFSLPCVLIQSTPVHSSPLQSTPVQQTPTDQLIRSKTQLTSGSGSSLFCLFPPPFLALFRLLALGSPFQRYRQNAFGNTASSSYQPVSSDFGWRVPAPLMKFALISNCCGAVRSSEVKGFFRVERTGCTWIKETWGRARRAAISGNRCGGMGRVI